MWHDSTVGKGFVSVRLEFEHDSIFDLTLRTCDMEKLAQTIRNDTPALATGPTYSDICSKGSSYWIKTRNVPVAGETGTFQISVLFPRDELCMFHIFQYRPM
jgi:hypothetical protein